MKITKRISRTIANLDPVRFFVVTAAVFGMLFLLITPPFQGADEVVHFFRSYQVSQGNLTVDVLPEGVGGSLPSSLHEVVDATNQPSIQFHPELKYDIHATARALAVRDVAGEEKFYDFANTAAYTPISYIPSAIGIGTARVLHLPPLVSLYAGRLGNLLAWIAIFALVIRLIPARKWAVVAIGLLPMGLFQASVLNGDVITTGALAVFLSLILYFRAQKKLLGKKELLFLLIVAIAMVLSKQIMFVFLPLVLLLDKRNFSSLRSAWIWKAMLVGAPLIIYGCWLVVSQGVDVRLSYLNGQNPTSQLSFILHNPHSFINVLWNTHFYSWGDYATRSFIGTFGWADAPLSELIVVIGYVGLFVLFAGGYEKGYKELLSIRGKQLLALVAVLYGLAVSAAMYVYYSPVGFKIIVGIQGRYYLPLAIAAIPLLRMRRITIDPVLYKRVAVGLPLFLLVASTITLFVRYYVHNV